jgi:hypothetical protein
MRGLKVRCIAKSTQTFRPEDGHPASLLEREEGKYRSLL